MDYKKIAQGVGAFVGATMALIGGAIAVDAYARQRKDDSGGPARADADATMATVTASDEPRPPADASANVANFSDMTGSGEPSFAPASADPMPTAPATDAEHVPTDLLADRAPGAHDRAPAAFRPDMDAPMTPAEREALRPATGPGPSLVSGIPNIAEEVVRPGS